MQGLLRGFPLRHLPRRLPLVQRGLRRLYIQHIISAGTGSRWSLIDRDPFIDGLDRYLFHVRRTCRVDVHLAISFDACLLYKEVTPLVYTTHHTGKSMIEVIRHRSWSIHRSPTGRSWSARRVSIPTFVSLMSTCPPPPMCSSCTRRYTALAYTKHQNVITAKYTI